MKPVKSVMKGRESLHISAYLRETISRITGTEMSTMVTANPNKSTVQLNCAMGGNKSADGYNKTNRNFSSGDGEVISTAQPL